MRRYSPNGWVCAAIAGKFGIDAVARALAAGVERSGPPELGS